MSQLVDKKICVFELFMSTHGEKAKEEKGNFELVLSKNLSLQRIFPDDEGNSKFQMLKQVSYPQPMDVILEYLLSVHSAYPEVEIHFENDTVKMYFPPC